MIQRYQSYINSKKGHQSVFYIVIYIFFFLILDIQFNTVKVIYLFS